VAWPVLRRGALARSPLHGGARWGRKRVRERRQGEEMDAAIAQGAFF